MAMAMATVVMLKDSKAVATLKLKYHLFCFFRFWTYVLPSNKWPRVSVAIRS